jgi:hypothetical protein
MFEKINAIVFDKRVIFAVVAVVCFLIFVVPLYSDPVVPQPGGWGEDSSKSELHGIYIVEDMKPEKLTEEALRLGIQYAERETGWQIPMVTYGPMPTQTCSSWDAEGWTDSPSQIPCKKGWIVVLQDDKLLSGAPTDGRQTHGRTFLGDENEDGWPDFPQDWATVVLTDGSLESDDPNADCSLPANAYANLWTHELLHGLGYDHTFTRIIPGVNAIVMERTGHILNDNLCDGGWAGAGLDTWESSRKKNYEKRL